MEDKYRRSKDDPIYVPEQGPNAGPAPSRELYSIMGGENIMKLLRDFYQELGRSSIAGMFPQDLEAAADRSALFFIGLLGGPPVYMERYGPPRMRARHMPFLINAEARKEWLRCFFKVLEKPEEYQIPLEHLPDFKGFLESFSNWMVNSEN